jgi:hypothetical protein
MVLPSNVDFGKGGNGVEIRLLLADGARISACEPMYLKWVDPPSAPVLVAKRLFRSPGRVRILAGPGSTHPLRGL